MKSLETKVQKLEKIGEPTTELFGAVIWEIRQLRQAVEGFDAIMSSLSEPQQALAGLCIINCPGELGQILAPLRELMHHQAPPPHRPGKSALDHHAQKLRLLAESLRQWQRDLPEQPATAFGGSDVTCPLGGA